MSVRESGNQVEMWMHEAGANSSDGGMFFVAAEPNELVVINITGKVDLATLAQLQGRMGMPNLGLGNGAPAGTACSAGGSRCRRGSGRADARSFTGAGSIFLQSIDYSCSQGYIDYNSSHVALDKYAAQEHRGSGAGTAPPGRAAGVRFRSGRSRRSSPSRMASRARPC